MRSAESACEDTGGKLIEKWKRDTLLRSEMEKLVPSKSAQSKQKVQNVLRKLSLKNRLKLDEPGICIWDLSLTDMLATLGEEMNVYIVLQNGEVLKLVAAFPSPPGLSKGQFILFANEWNKRKNYARASVHDGEDCRLILEYDLSLDWMPDRQFDEVFSNILSLFTKTSLLMTKDILQMALSPDEFEPKAHILTACGLKTLRDWGSGSCSSLDLDIRAVFFSTTGPCVAGC